MNIETFNYINNLIELNNENWADYEFIALKELNNIILDNNQTYIFSDILENMKGIFPVDLYNLIKKYKPKIKLHPEDNHINDFKRNNINGWHQVAKKINLPSPHFANYDWRYMEESTNKIIDYVLNNSQKKVNICCLGSPTTALELIRRNHYVTIMDINKPLIDSIKRMYDNSKIECVIYDAQKKLPKQFINKFDIVLMNPPWYLDYYKLFISRALQLLKKDGGEIILPVFPPLSRHTSLKDLLFLKQFIEETNFTDIKSLGYVNFETPVFEKTILENNQIPIYKNWRNAELISIIYDENRKLQIQEDNILEKRTWKRFYNEKTKSYYVIDSSNFLKKDFESSIAKNDCIKILSRKEINNIKFDIWNNRNKMKHKKNKALKFHF